MNRNGFALLLVLGLGGCGGSTTNTLPGYVEAEYTRVAAPIAGRLTQLSVQRGGHVTTGAPLFVLDADNEKAAVDEAKARLQRAEAQAADLGKGKRKDEVAVLLAQLAAGQSALVLARSDLKRQTELAHAGFVSGANLDALQTKVQASAAQVDEINAQLRVAKLASREDTRVAAGADITAAQASLAQSQWRLDQKAIRAPVTATVDDTLYRLGEWIPAGAPVVNLLAPDGIKIRFFVPQARLSEFKPGQKIHVRCDGCGAPRPATITYVAQSAEFTPPVIYSQENRAKLVFLVEARPESTAALNPGQPVDVVSSGI